MFVYERITDYMN